jgi:uncharacterized protein HemY
MWEVIGITVGMVVLMLLYSLIPYVFDLPDTIAKYFRGRSRRAQAVSPSADPDEEAARALGEGLRRGELSSETVAEVTAAFWAADPPNRRALAHMVAGMTADGEVVDADVLAVVRSLRARSELPSEGDKKPAPSTDIKSLPGFSK